MDSVEFAVQAMVAISLLSCAAMSWCAMQRQTLVLITSKLGNVGWFLLHLCNERDQQIKHSWKASSSIL